MTHPRRYMRAQTRFLIAAIAASLLPGCATTEQAPVASPSGRTSKASALVEAPSDPFAGCGWAPDRSGAVNCNGLIVVVRDGDSQDWLEESIGASTFRVIETEPIRAPRFASKAKTLRVDRAQSIVQALIIVGSATPTRTVLCTWEEIHPFHERCVALAEPLLVEGTAALVARLGAAPGIFRSPLQTSPECSIERELASIQVKCDGGDVRMFGAVLAPGHEQAMTARLMEMFREPVDALGAMDDFDVTTEQTPCWLDGEEANCTQIAVTNHGDAMDAQWIATSATRLVHCSWEGDLADPPALCRSLIALRE